MQKHRNYSIDILRGIALILISVYHYYQFQGTYIGVIVFFSLTGYLVTDSLLLEDFYYVDYWKKKIKKLAPLLFIAVFISTLAVFFLEKGLTDLYRFGALSTIFAVSNLYQAFSKVSYFESHREILPLVHTWALSLEIQFYFFYPMLLFWWKEKKVEKKTMLELLLLLANLSMLCMFFRYLSGNDLSRLYYGTDTRLFSFFLAAAVAVWAKEPSCIAIHKNILAFFTILEFVVLGFFSFFLDYTSAWNYLGGFYFASIVTSLSILYCFQVDFSEKLNIFPLSILAHLGKHGYSYYLWQYILMIFANEYFKWVKISYHLTVLIQVILLIIISEASYYWIERRNFSWKEITGLFFVSIAFLCLLPKADIKEEENLEKIAISEPVNKISEESVEIPIEEEEKGELSISKEKITFIGDSVMKMCEKDLKQDFPNSYVDAAVSRQFLKLPAILENLKSEEKLYPIVVIHLGSNGPVQEKTFDEVMGLLEGHQVYFINTVVSKSWESNVNQLLLEKIEEYPNIGLLDWYQYAKGKSKWFYKDATHPKPNGAKEYSKFILQELSNKATILQP